MLGSRGGCQNGLGHCCAVTADVDAGMVPRIAHASFECETRLKSLIDGNG